MPEENKYIAKNGKTLTAFQFKKGDEIGICKKYNKPFILQEDGIRIFPVLGDYIFSMDGSTKINTLMPDLFEENTKRLV